MNKIVFSLAILICSISFAEMNRPEGQTRDDEYRHHMMDEHHKGLKQKLNLSDEQEKKFKAAMEAHHQAMKPIGEKMKDSFKKLESQLKEKASDEQIKATLESLKSTRLEMNAEQEKFHNSLASFLTPTQQAQMLMGMSKMMGPKRFERREHDGHYQQDPPRHQKPSMEDEHDDENEE